MIQNAAAMHEIAENVRQKRELNKKVQFWLDQVEDFIEASAKFGDCKTEIAMDAIVEEPINDILLQKGYHTSSFRSGTSDSVTLTILW